MPGIERLVIERRCDNFLRRLYGLLNLLERLSEQLADPSVEMTSDTLMYLQFKTDAAVLRDLLDDQQAVDAFVRLHPQHTHLIEAGRNLVAVLERLHTVRNDVLRPHLRPDGKDVVSHAFPNIEGVLPTTEVKAAYNGLTVQQQQALQAAHNIHGYVYLTTSERNKLRNAILTELHGTI